MPTASLVRILCSDNGTEGWRFAGVWGPGATAVEVCGGFDGCGEAGGPTHFHGAAADTGVWSALRPRPHGWRAMPQPPAEHYKYRVHPVPTAVW